MLRKITVENFFSVGEEQTLFLNINKKDHLDDSSFHVRDDLYLNLVTCLVGNNASGKTNMLKALAFLIFFINRSYSGLNKEKEIPYEPHKLKLNKTSRIEIEFFEKQELYQYSIEFDKHKIYREYLGKNKVRDFSRVFEITRFEKNEKIIFSDLKVNGTDQKRFRERENVSLLSSLISLDYLPAFSIFQNAKYNITHHGYRTVGTMSKFLSISDNLYENDEIKNNVLSFSKNVDLGISDFSFEEAEFRNTNNPEEEITQFVLECVHKSKVGEFVLELIEESNGTQNAYQTLIDVFLVLQSGGVCLYDEIDSGLHPQIVRKIVSLFEDKETNPNQAQLIFTSHQHLLLNDRTKTQIYLAEKDLESFETEVYRLDEIDGVRNDENFFAKYITGTYGGLPNIKWL